MANNRTQILYTKQQGKMTTVVVQRKRSKLNHGLLGEWPFVPKIPVAIEKKEPISLKTWLDETSGYEPESFIGGHNID